MTHEPRKPQVAVQPRRPLLARPSRAGHATGFAKTTSQRKGVEDDSKEKDRVAARDNAGGHTVAGSNRRLRTQRRGQSRGTDLALRDRATVLAIFRGLSTMVVTDAFVPGRSRWANPFMAGDEPRITLFDPPTPGGHDDGEGGEP